MRDLNTAECAEISGGFVFVVPLRESKPLTPEESLAFQMALGTLFGVALGIVGGEVYPMVGPKLGAALGGVTGFFTLPFMVMGIYGAASYGFDLVKPLYL